MQELDIFLDINKSLETSNQFFKIIKNLIALEVEKRKIIIDDLYLSIEYENDNSLLVLEFEIDSNVYRLIHSSEAITLDEKKYHSVSEIVDDLEIKILNGISDV